MARTPTERLLQQIQTLVPRLARHRRRALARGVVGARVAGSAHRPALAPALATAGIARAATLADAGDAGIAAPTYPIDTADPTAAGAAGGPSAGVRRRQFHSHPRRRPGPVRPRACGADLRRGIRAHGTGGPLAPERDAAHRRADVVLVRMRVRQRGAALPVATPRPPSQV
jgi:hypothetical protein